MRLQDYFVKTKFCIKTKLKFKKSFLLGLLNLAIILSLKCKLQYNKKKKNDFPRRESNADFKCIVLNPCAIFVYKKLITGQSFSKQNH